MKRSLTIAANAVVAKILEEDEDVKNIVQDKLSYLVEGHEFMNAFSAGGWNGRSSFFSRRTRTFPAGFVHLVHHELTRQGYPVRLVIKQAPEPLGPENPIVDEFGNADPRYDFQLHALRQVEKHKRGIIQVATGGGKSKVAKLIAARFRRMTAFITTRGVLLYQMRDSFEKDCNFNTGIIGDGIWRPVRGVNCCMVQTFIAQLKEPKLGDEVLEIRKQLVNKELRLSNAQVQAAGQARYDEKVSVRNRTMKLLELVEVVIGEEAHEAGGNSYYEILQHCKNAHIRVALTATPFMRDDAEDNMRLMAAFGPILVKVSEKLLIDRGILATPYFKYVESEPHQKLRKTSPWQRAYQLGYIENEAMIRDIVNDAKKARAYGLPVLTLIQRKKHGAVLKKAMMDAGLNVAFIQGEDDQDGRKKALRMLAKGQIDVLIGSTIVDVGIDVPAIGLVQLAGGGRAEVALRQRIGRGLRAKKGVPNYAFVADYSPKPVNLTLRDHSRQRRAIVEATPGFAENILKLGRDFPWELFARAAA